MRPEARAHTAIHRNTVPMSRCTALLTAVAALVLAEGALAESFGGFALGGGASRHSLDVDATSSDSTLFPASGSARETGLMLDLAYSGSLAANVRLTGGLRLYPIALETAVFADDRVRIEDIGAIYSGLGYVFEGINMVYAVLELGAAEMTSRQTGFKPVSDEIATSAIGIGYMRRLDADVHVFVELLGRAYEDVRVSYVDVFVDTRDYDITGGNLTLGIALRF